MKPMGAERRLASIYARCVRAANGCLIWTGCVATKSGYARIGYQGKTWGGHQLVFELAVCPLKPGEHVDHRCHNEDLTCPGGDWGRCRHRPCLEPTHLEAVSPAENARRAARHARQAPGSRWTGAVRGTCKKGLHPWIPENVRRAGLQELCIPCARLRQQAYEARQRGGPSRARPRFKGTRRYEGPRGVRWYAQITVSYQVRYLGSFADEVAAARAYDAAALEAWGPFARLNFPGG